jgi:hypothetical protein
MIDSYWDLYVAYLDKCVRDNRVNDIDPHHYEMEWNHTLPQCIFKGHGPGQYLTLKQHAIASALQSLVFDTNCMCGWHKEHLPQPLLDLAWEFYVEAVRKIGRENARLSRGICDPATHLLPHVVEAKRLNGLKVSAEGMLSSRGIFDPQFKDKISETRVKSGNKAVIEKTGIHDPKNKQLVLDAGRIPMEQGLGIFDPKNKQRVLEGSQKAGQQAVENKTGIHSPDYKNSDKYKEDRDRVQETLRKNKAAIYDPEVRKRAQEACQEARRKPVELTKIVTGEKFVFPSNAEAARAFNLQASDLSSVCLGKRNHTGGFTARYL